MCVLISKTAKSKFSSSDTGVEKAPNFDRLAFLLNIYKYIHIYVTVLCSLFYSILLPFCYSLCCSFFSNFFFSINSFWCLSASLFGDRYMTSIYSTNDCWWYSLSLSLLYNSFAHSPVSVNMNELYKNTKAYYSFADIHRYIIRRMNLNDFTHFLFFFLENTSMCFFIHFFCMERKRGC